MTHNFFSFYAPDHHNHNDCYRLAMMWRWRRSRVGRTLVSAGELSLSYARLLAGQMITL